MSNATSGNVSTISSMLSLYVDEASVKSSMNSIDAKIEESTKKTSAAQKAAMERNAATHTAASAAKYGTRLQELGRGFEDFVVSASMAKTTADGLAMGLRGSANNAAQLAASFNPVAGAAVAIGTSLATIIVPAVARWLFDTKELEASAKRWEENLKLSGKEALKVAETLAKMRGAVRDDAEAKPGDKGKNPVEKVKQAERERRAAGDRAIETQRVLSQAEQRLAAAKKPEEKLKRERDIAYQAHAASVFALNDLNVMLGAEDNGARERFERAQERLNQLQNRIKAEQAAVDTVRKAHEEADRDQREAAHSEQALKEQFATELAQAEADVKLAATESLQAKLDDMNNKAENNRIKTAERDYEEMATKIKALKLADIAEENRMIAEAAKARDTIIAKSKSDLADKDAAEIRQNAALQQQLDKDGAKDTDEKFDEIALHYQEMERKIDASRGTAEEKDRQRAQNAANFEKANLKEAERLDNKIRSDALDAKIAAKSEEIDALQERVSKAGNAAGSSAAMVRGSQAAESAINRAISGSRSVEDTLKTQLKVQQDMLKSLNKQKQTIVASIS